MEFFKNTHFNFIGRSKLFLALSGLAILAGVVSLVVHGGPRLSVDFTGGTLLQIQVDRAVPTQDVRSALSAAGYPQAVIQRFGTDTELLVRAQVTEEEGHFGQAVMTALEKGFPQRHFELRREESVGPRVGDELKEAALLAIAVALGLILVYVAWRFEFRFAVAAIAALVHDVTITVGFFSLMNKEISLAIIGALLAIVGYSLNDTIVVFDRIREDLRLLHRERYPVLVNQSINETLSRTILTSGTTLLVVATLMIFGGSVIRDFATALFIGIFVGTYSSVCVASPIVVFWQGRVEAKARRAAIPGMGTAQSKAPSKPARDKAGVA